MMRMLKTYFWSITGDFIYRNHVEPRVKLYMPKEESFFIPLKYIDFTKNTSASLDVMLEKNIDDCWNVDGDRELSDTWIGFSRFTILKKNSSDGFLWSGERLTRKQTTSSPEKLWSKMWKHMSDASKRKEKKKWAIEKPKLDHVRNLRGIYFIDPKDEEFKEIMNQTRFYCRSGRVYESSIGRSSSHISRRSHCSKKNRRFVNGVKWITYPPTHILLRESQLYIFEDSEAVIKMIIKGRTPTVRHVSRPHRVVLDWLFDRMNLEHKIQIRYVDKVGSYDASSNALQNADKEQLGDPPQCWEMHDKMRLYCCCRRKARDRGWKELATSLIKITSLQKGWIP